MQHYPEEYSESNMKAYCQGEEYVEPIACYPLEQHKLEFAIANLMFVCNSEYIYDLYEVDQKAY